jgi:hypothetical protein
MANNKGSEIGELQSILMSKTFYNILEEHKLSLQAEVNKFVAAQDLINAYGALRALKDTDRILMLTQKKLEELKK